MAQFKCPECGATDDNVEGPAPICNGFGVNVGATDREREGYHVATTMERSGSSGGGEKKSTAKRSTSKRSGSRRKATTAKTRRTTSSATRSGTRTAGGRSGRAGESA